MSIYSICSDGSCRYLTNKKLTENDSFGEKNYPNKELFDKIVSKTKETAEKNGVNYHIGKNFSIDTIIAQFVHIDEIIDMGCNCIEKEPVIDQPALHTFEHLGATFLRSHKEWADRIVYFGPMGCRTGFYTILEGNLDSESILPLIKEMLAWIIAFEGTIPGHHVLLSTSACYKPVPAGLFCLI